MGGLKEAKHNLEFRYVHYQGHYTAVLQDIFHSEGDLHVLLSKHKDLFKLNPLKIPFFGVNILLVV